MATPREPPRQFSCGKSSRTPRSWDSEQQIVQKAKDPEPLTKPVGSPPRWGRGESDVSGRGAVGPGAIPVPLVQGPLGLSQLFSLISPSHSALGIPEGFWEHRQGGGI